MLSRSSRAAALGTLVALGLMLGCGSKVTVVDGGGGGDDGPDGVGGQGAQGATGGGGSAPVQPGEVTGVSAPTQTTVEVRVAGDTSSLPQDPAAFLLTSAHGDLTVEAVTFDAAAKVLVLTTNKQKLGVEYDLVIQAPGSDYHLEGGPFLAADTALFWATDFTDFSDFEVLARRTGVGQNVVLYETDDVVANDVAETIQIFDQQIYPIETQLLGPAPDRDGNGRIVLLGLDGHGYYGGYFSPINSVSDEVAQEWGYHSNEMEMLYVSVPDLDFQFDPGHVVPHELSHLLYNEQHDFFSEDWSWHNEGLAECAVHAVNGSNPTAEWYFVNATDLAAGKSLVQWEYGNYAQYVQAYVFWTYVASRLDGVSSYGDLFKESGSPLDMSALFQAELGQTFEQVQLDFLTAAWLQAPSGPYGFNGMLDLGAQPLSTSLPGQQQLTTYEGVFFTGAQGEVTPSGQGPDVRIRSIDAMGFVDDAAPFSAAGGVVIALNALQAPFESATQPSGTFAPAPPPPPALPLSQAGVSAWKHPPPLKPANRKQLLSWRSRVHGH